MLVEQIWTGNDWRNFNYLIAENKICSKYSLKCSFDKGQDF